MKTLAILSQKGGSGKTTLSTTLAVAAEAHGLTTAILDLDKQASAAIWGDRRAGGIPAVEPAQAPRLGGYLEQAKKQGAHLVILDTPPEAADVAAAAAAAADAVLIPCRPSGFDLDAVGASVRIARTAGKQPFVVVYAAPVQGAETDETFAAIKAAGVELAPVVIHQRKAFSSRTQEGLTAYDTDPKGKAAHEARELLLWLCEKVIKLPIKKDNKVTI